jgi:hypothetical protein
MTIFPINGRNERMGKLFKAPKHLLKIDGKPAIECSVNYMSALGPYIIICGDHYDRGLRFYNRVVVPPTKNVIETLRQGIKGSFQQELYIVDCDIVPIRLNKPQGNTVYLFPNVEQRKHYSNFELTDGFVSKCNEKDEVLEYAGAGIYYFETIATFFKYSNYCTSVSEVISKMIANNEWIKGDTTSEIFRFGTLEDITGLVSTV